MSPRRNQHILIIELLLPVRDGRQSLLDVVLELFDVEEVRDQVLVPAEFQEGPCDHGGVLLLTLLPINHLLRIVNVFVQLRYEQFP